MTLLEFFFIISWIIILVLAIDIWRKEKFNAVHFLLFILMGGWLLTFALFPWILKGIWDVFWVARWADVLVYWSIVFLLYFVLLLLSKHVENKEALTSLIRELAIENSSKKRIKGKEVFIIPSYNEWEVIKTTIKNILDNGYKNILVINDWSRDNSREILENFGDQITVLTHYKNRWQWAALETGFEYVRRYGDIEYVITFDADGQHSLSDLKEFEKIMKEHKKIDVLLWSRFMWKKKIGVPFTRKIILKLGVIFTYFISNINLTDTHNGYRVIRKNALEKIRITQDGMTHASEIIDIISTEKIVYKEVPVHIIYTEYSLAKWQSSWNAISIALRIIWSKFFK